MGRPGPRGETVSSTQLSGAPEAPRDALDEAVPGPEDSDLVPSVTLAATLSLLFLLLSAWLLWNGPCQGAPQHGSWGGSGVSPAGPGVCQNQANAPPVWGPSLPGMPCPDLVPGCTALLAAAPGGPPPLETPRPTLENTSLLTSSRNLTSPQLCR